MSSPETQPQADGKSFETLLDCYISLIRDIAEAVEFIRPEIGADCYRYLRSARTKLTHDSSVKNLAATRDLVHEELKVFSEKMRQLQDTNRCGTTATPNTWPRWPST